MNLLKRTWKLARKEYACSKNYSKRTLLAPAWVGKDPNIDPIRMYVMVDRANLTLVQAGVQAGHALVEFASEYGRTCELYKDWVSKWKTLIFIEGTQKDMDDLINYHKQLKKDYSCFYEPDMETSVGDEAHIGWRTAVAFEPQLAMIGRVVYGKYKLLS